MNFQTVKSNKNSTNHLHSVANMRNFTESFLNEAPDQMQPNKHYNCICVALKLHDKVWELCLSPVQVLLFRFGVCQSN